MVITNYKLSLDSDSEPFWGTPDANAAWCEAKFSAYSVNEYLCEFYNAISSLVLLYGGIVCVIAAYRVRRRELRFYWSAVTLIVIGCGSFLFHGTLRRWGQVLDEVPMFIECLAVIYISAESKSKDKPKFSWLPTLLVGVIAFYTYVYLSWPIIYFLASYAIGVFISTILFYFHVKEGGLGFEKQLFWKFIIYYFGGFICWNLDNIFCDHLHTLGLNLHLFWHVLAAYGTHMFFMMMLAVRIRHLEESKTHSVKCKLNYYPYGFPVLEVEKVKRN